jgi:hypothetical protein
MIYLKALANGPRVLIFFLSYNLQALLIAKGTKVSIEYMYKIDLNSTESGSLNFIQLIGSSNGISLKKNSKTSVHAFSNDYITFSLFSFFFSYFSRIINYSSIIPSSIYRGEG